MENIPVIIGRYRLSKTLGIGAFGKVKLGEHTLTGHKVAVKILNRGKIQALEMEEKVKREINILKLCRHPHIVRLHEIIDTPSDIFMVMEYAPNGELFDYIVSKGRPTTEEAQRLFRQIVTAVEYCHYHNIVHRDLKPENLLLDQHNNLKIADFGLSNIMRDGEFLRTSCGSPNYAAPEVIMGTLYAGPEVDVWSCGVILYALLCGSLPFDDESIPSLFKKIKSGMYSLPSHLSSETRDLVPRMLLVDPMKRITIREIKEHRWFTQDIPLYLTLTPAQLEEQALSVDEEVVETLCKLPYNGITRERILHALAHKGYKKKGEFEHELRVVYELVQGNKLDKERLRQYVRANRYNAQTPPTFQRAVSSPQGYKYPSNYAEEVKNSLRQNRQLGQHPRTPGATQNPVEQAQSNPATPTSSTTEAALVKRRRWYLGIQSKKDPAHVMTEVYRALLQLGCEWRMLSSYRIQCKWMPDARGMPRGVLRSPTVGVGYGGGISRRDGGGTLGGIGAKSREEGYRVVAGLTLYKELSQSTKSGGPSLGSSEMLDPVQTNIYLLDFNKREGDQFSFMTLCAKIITQLKTLNAQSRLQMGRLQGAAGQALAIPGVHGQQYHTSPQQQQQQQQQQHPPQLPGDTRGFRHPGVMQPMPGQHYLPQPPPQQQQHQQHQQTRGPAIPQGPIMAPTHQRLSHGYPVGGDARTGTPTQQQRQRAGTPHQHD